MSEVQEALRLYPEFADGHLTLGIAYTEQRRFELAITHLNRALTIQPDLATARNQLGRIYTAQGNLDQAVQTYRALVRHHPEVAEARHNLAVALARHGRRAEAVSQFGEAVRIRPDLHAARIDLAALLLEMQRPQEAIDTLQTAISALAADSGGSDTADLTEVHYRLSIAYLMLRQNDNAIGELEIVLRRQPRHAGAHMYLGRIRPGCSNLPGTGQASPRGC